MGSFIGAKVETQRLNALKNQYTFQSLILNARRESTTAKMQGRESTCNALKTKIDKWNNTAEDKRKELIASNNRDNIYVKKLGLTGTDSDLKKTFETTTEIDGVTADFSVDEQYMTYEAEDEYLDTKINNLDSLLTLLGKQIENTENLEKDGIKDNSWWCVGGGS